MAESNNTQVLVFLATNLVAVLLVWLAYRRRKVASFIIALVFSVAALINTHLALADPMLYVDHFGTFAISLYSDFIFGAFIQMADDFVLMLSALQMTLGLLIFFGQKRLLKAGLVGGLLFFLALVPLGLGAAFPAPLFFGWSIFILLKTLPGQNQ